MLLFMAPDCGLVFDLVKVSVCLCVMDQRRL